MEEKNYWEIITENYYNWSEYVKEAIITRLYEYEGGAYYGCDLSHYLFESENCDGSLTCNTYWSKHLINAYWDDFNELYEDYLSNFGEENAINILDRPEAFVVIMLLEEASNLLSRCKFIDDNWDKKIELNKQNIKKIERQLKEL